MESLTSLDNSSLAHIASFLHQDDAIALHASSKSFRDVYPTHILKVFALDATIDDYVDFCRWIAKRTIDTLEVCVDINKWNSVVPVLDESSFEHVTLCPNYLRKIREMAVFPACRSRKSGFIERGRMMPASVMLREMRTTDDSQTRLHLYPDAQHVAIMPYFASEIFGTPTVLTLSCHGTVQNLDRIPRNLKDFCISNATIDQRMLIDMAELFTSHLTIKGCQIIDPTIKPCTFHTERLYISLNVLCLIEDTVNTTFIEIECPGTIPSDVDYPVLEKIAIVSVTGRCQSLEAVGAFVARSFPNATPKYNFNITPV